MKQSPIFILGCTKSGTSLLRNLFDGHPDLFVVPTESHFFQNTGHWVSYYFRRTQPKKLDYEEMKTALINWIFFVDKKSNFRADGFTAGKWDKDVFLQSMKSVTVNSLKELSDLYIESMYCSLNEKPFENLRFVEKSVENAEFVLEWLQLYPDAKFIHILRNPYSNLLAIRKYLNIKSFPFIKHAILSMYNSYYFLYKNQRLVNSEKYKVIIYDDLIAEPEKTLQSVCRFLNIEYSDILLKPTVLGEEWKGNSTSGKSFSGISIINLSNWKKEISNYEVSIVNKLFPHVLQDFNFEKIETKHSVLRNARKEMPLNYLLNRFFLYYMPTFKTKEKIE